MVKSIKEYFSNKSAEQIFSLCLLVCVVTLMLFCAIVRIFGCLWFSADLSAVEEPSVFWQEVIKGILMTVELIFVYKILCRAKWLICFAISIIETLIGILLGFTVSNPIVSNLFYMACYLIIPVFFVKSWFSFVESIILYLLQFCYAALFLVGRIGIFDTNATYNFIYSILGTVDYKLFIVSFYLLIKYFGGIKLWKNQKRLIFQTDLPSKKKTAVE